jgi:uncharacterized cofD-like protein
MFVNPRAAEELRPSRSSALRVVAVGGGTGLPIVLEGLKRALCPDRDEPPSEMAGDRLTAIVTLTALGRLEHDADILGVDGRMFPATTEDVHLRAELQDGSSIEGESRISSVLRTIRRVSLEPHDPEPHAPSIDAVRRADLVVIGPGSLYTSLIPGLLVRELREAIRQSGARVVLVMNLTTEPGETDGYTAVDHLLAIRRHAPEVPIHDVLLNATPIPDERACSTSRAVQVSPDVELLRALGYRPVMADLLGAGPRILHDAHKLAAAILKLNDDASFAGYRIPASQHVRS